MNNLLRIHDATKQLKVSRNTERIYVNDFLGLTNCVEENVVFYDRFSNANKTLLNTTTKLLTSIHGTLDFY